MAKTKRTRRNIYISVICVFGISLLAVAGFGAYDYYHTTRVGTNYPSATTITTDESVSEKPITVNNTDYVVPADQPREIQIPSLGVTGYVQYVGVTATNAMATPNNINFAGWYVRSPAPGDQGVSIINGHAGGRYTVGIFRRIDQLKAGDVVKVQMGNLSWRNFVVVSSNVYSVSDAAIAIYKNDSSIDRELHLVTCDGDFDDTSQTYNKRAVVVAKFEQ